MSAAVDANGSEKHTVFFSRALDAPISLRFSSGGFVDVTPVLRSGGSGFDCRTEGLNF